MSTTTHQAAAPSAGSTPPGAVRTPRPAPAPIPFGRVVGVEMRKTFDTRAGAWLMIGIGVAAVLATAAVVVWAPDSALSYDTFGTAIGAPMAMLLPIVAVLAVTSEWSQRTGLTTFTLVPRRSRTIAAKAVVTLVVGVASMLLAMGVGAIGAWVGPTLRGVEPVFDLGVGQVATLVLAQVLGMFVGFMLGVVTRSSPAAIVGYFLFNALVPTLTNLLAALQEWFRDVQPWVDFSLTQSRLYDGGLSATDWAQLGVTGALWLVLPTAVGLWVLLRSEIS